MISRFIYCAAFLGVLLTLHAISPIPLGFWKPASSSSGSGSADPIYGQDDFESYTDAVNAEGLNGGSYWNGAYVSRNGLLGMQSSDDMESYSDTAAVNALNAGAGWNGAYLDR